MTRTTDRLDNLTLPLLIVIVATLVFSVLYIVAMPESLDGVKLALSRYGETRNPITLLITLGMAFLNSRAFAFMLVMILAWFSAHLLLGQYLQQLYALTWEDTLGVTEAADRNADSPTRASGLLFRILYGLPEEPPFAPILGAREGQVDPDGPEIMRKVGGPGFLSIGHDTAVVIARGGTIINVLGPGWHRVGPFERIWDVVDLRPQRRNLHVETHSRDGIPIYCDAEILFRLDNGEEPPEETETFDYPYPFTEKAADNVLKVTAGKVVLKPGGKRFTDWSTRMPNGILDGVIRNTIEQYRLDEYLTPADNGEPLFAKLERDIEKQVREDGLKAGARVLRVTLGPILPMEEAISQQWVESWRSEWDMATHELEAEAKALGTEAIKKARVLAQADLVTTIMEGLRDFDTVDPNLQETIIMMRFMDAMRSLAETDPLVRGLMFKEAEGLQRIIKTMTEITQQPSPPPQLQLPPTNPDL